MRKLLITLLMQMLFLAGYGQDVLLNLPASVPAWINPAAIGNSGYEWSFAAGYRTQWPVAGRYKTSLFSGEYALQRMGFGLQFLKDRVGSKPTDRNMVNFGFSYLLPLTNDLNLSGGVRMSYESRTSSNIILIDDFLDDNQVGPGEEFDGIDTNILGGSIGLMLISNYFYTGFSIDNVLNQTISSAGENFLLDENLKYVAHAGGNLPFSVLDLRFEVDGFASWQGPARQGEAVISASKLFDTPRSVKNNKKFVLSTGVGLRTFVFKGQDLLSARDAVIFNLSLTSLDPRNKKNAWSGILTYGADISQLDQTGGTYQFQLIYNFSKTKETSTWMSNTRKIRKRIPSPIECAISPEGITVQNKREKKKFGKSRKQKNKGKSTDPGSGYNKKS